MRAPVAQTTGDPIPHTRRAEEGASQEAVDRMRDIIEQLKNDDRMKAAAANLLGATRAAMADPSRQVDLSRSIAGTFAG